MFCSKHEMYYVYCKECKENMDFVVNRQLLKIEQQEAQAEVLK